MDQAQLTMIPPSPRPHVGFQEQPLEHLLTNALQEKPHSKQVISQAIANYIYDNKKSEGNENRRIEGDDNRKNECELKIRTQLPKVLIS